MPDLDLCLQYAVNWGMITIMAIVIFSILLPAKRNQCKEELEADPIPTVSIRSTPAIGKARPPMTSSPLRRPSFGNK